MDEMTFAHYQQVAMKTWNPPPREKIIDIAYLALGVVGESGEVAEKIKKVLRNDLGILSEERRFDLRDELGDVLWYITILSHELGFDLEDIARRNNEKLLSRKERNVIASEGDNR